MPRLLLIPAPTDAVPDRADFLDHASSLAVVNVRLA
jgi:hypothetical protein